MKIENKKGQITIFIILGIVVLLSFGFYAYSKISSQESSSKESVKSIVGVKQFIDDCAKKTSIEGLELIGKQGGYIKVPKIINFLDTSFWYLDSANIQPTIDEIATNFEGYIEENLPICAKFDYFLAQGYDITSQKPKANVNFDANDVSVKIDYFVQIKKDGKTDNYDGSFFKLNVRFRKAYELSSKIVNRELDSKFEFYNPTKGLVQNDFTVTYQILQNETIVYKITDKAKSENNKNYVFSFANRFRNTDLKRTIELQENSNTIGTVVPYIVYSPDRMAELYVMPQTTMNLHGASVKQITVKQHYPKNVSRDKVPTQELADDTVIYKQRTWNLTYPIYEFEPTGMRFNNPQRLVLYWDESRIPLKGKVGILYTEGDGWRPLPSKANYTAHYVYTDIPGFSNFTPVDCGTLVEQDADVTTKIDPGMECWIKTIVIAAIIAVICYFGMGYFAFGKGLVGGITTTEAGAVTGATVANELSMTAIITTLQLGVQAYSGIIVAGVIAGSLVGGSFIGSELTFSVAKDTVVFTPACDQVINVQKTLTNGEGVCKPDDKSFNAEAGVTTYVHAQLQKCKSSFMPCGSCELKCALKYK